MPKVLETLNEYQSFLLYDKYLKPSTLRRINLSLRYFCELYAMTDTISLTKTDMGIFFEYMKTRKSEIRNSKGEYPLLMPNSIRKTMSIVKTYTRRLLDKGYVNRVSAADVPM